MSSDAVYGPQTFADYLGSVIDGIDRVQKRVRDHQEEELQKVLREAEEIRRRFVRRKWRWLADRLLHREWMRNEPTPAEIVIAAELSWELDHY